MLRGEQFRRAAKPRLDHQDRQPPRSARADRTGLESLGLSARLLGGEEVQSPDGQSQAPFGGAQEDHRGDGALDWGGPVAALHRTNDPGQAGFESQNRKALRVESSLSASHNTRNKTWKILSQQFIWSEGRGNR